MKKLFLILSVCFLCGCKSGATNINMAQTTATIITSTNEHNETFLRDSPYSHPEKTEEINMDRATQLTSTVRTVNNIDKAYVLIASNTIALVGISLKKELSEDEIISIKKEIEKRIMAIDYQITKVTVTTTPELTEKISNEATESTNSNVSDEFKNIVMRATPTL